MVYFKKSLLRAKMNTKTNLNDEVESLSTLSERLKFLMDNLGVKQVHLASKLGVTPQAIHNLCNRNIRFSRHTKEIAKLLNANENWLESGKGQPFEKHPEISEIEVKNELFVQHIPIYYQDQLHKVRNKEAFSKLNPVEFTVSLDHYNSNTFAFYLEDNELSPRFEKGDIIIIEPSTKVENGMLALVYSSQFEKSLFCYLYKNNNELLTGFLPSKIGCFEIKASDIIYGIYRSCIKKANY
jgi:transcriptional regulator with XRE-family HTH domain